MDRLNPIPMCNCDQGAYCSGVKTEESEPIEPAMFHRMLQETAEGKTCKAVPASQCGTTPGVNTW